MPGRVRHVDLRPAAVRRAREEADMGFYRRAPWRKLRAQFLAANPICVRCEAERDELVPATVAHHVLERLARPDLALAWDNLEALCDSCHSKHHGGPAR